MTSRRAVFIGFILAMFACTTSVAYSQDKASTVRSLLDSIDLESTPTVVVQYIRTGCGACISRFFRLQEELTKCLGVKPVILCVIGARRQAEYVAQKRMLPENIVTVFDASSRISSELFSDGGHPFAYLLVEGRVLEIDSPDAPCQYVPEPLHEK